MKCWIASGRPSVSKVVTTDLAERDCGEILGYLNGTLCNPQAAANFSEKVRKAFVTLDGDPLAFPECSEARLKARGYRKCVIGGYLFIYRHSKEDGLVYVLRFFHCLQNYAEKL